MTGPAEMSRVAQEATKEIKPPATVPLEADDLPFFHTIVAEMGTSEWSVHQVELAAMLARHMRDMEREQRLYREEGSVIKLSGGMLVVNPRKSVIAAMTAGIMKFRTTLSLNSSSKMGPINVANAERRTRVMMIEANARKANGSGKDGEISDEGLLA